ncbi:bifunctional metallophosphatase/5'-nucleotidase [Paraliobacillus sediminis]|uniref:bifunctional metallophosphatase/5'-nucleotidase n=1 Tax=Paraliobacillus sediminis TaxID=1885916 RepID=UPI000E3B7220|nr:bifunctional UDP-sugar hydrolase/5'-nucleotidase [Paraliobacillus sediminis]
METKKITLLYTSDVHGYILPTNYSDHQERALGLAKLATVIKQKRKHDAIILLDNGDLIQGSPFTFYHAKYHSDRPNPMVKVANEMGYTSSVFGNHEFNYGLDYLRSVIEQADFPWLSATVVNKEDNEPAFGKPYLMKEVDGIKIAILGVTTHYIPNWEDPKNIPNLAFVDAVEATKEWVAHIKKEEQPDVCIVSYHGGFERDLETGEPTEPLTGENQGYRMCHEVEGIDILLTGHQHRSIATELNGVTVVQPSNNAQLLGEVSMTLTKESGSWKMTDSKPNLLEVDASIEADQTIVNLVQDLEHKTQEWLDTPIGQMDGDMSITDPLTVRLKEHPFVEFVNKVQMDVANVTISNTALFNNDSPGFPKNVTMRDIVSNYVYPNTLKVVRITGKDIKDALEKSATYFVIDKDGEVAVNPAYMNPKPQHYNYDMWEGIEYELKISNPIGDRVASLNYQGAPINDEQEYDVVMNNYRAGGGGNFTMFQGKPVVKDIPTDMTELIANYIIKQKMIKVSNNSNWKVIK